ncbi:MAG: tetratricopeptide repeat protein [Alphaproteobacteria bacterium]|nr:tetratricopeptide repeat protein [Alphaproteobacteria bacterium]
MPVDPSTVSNDNVAAAEATLRRCGDLPDEAIDLAEAALALALIDGGSVDPAPYRRHLAALAEDLVAADLRALLKQVAGDSVELGPTHYSPVGNRAALLRLHNNIKTRLLRLNRAAEAARAAHAMLWLAPRDGGLWRESGLIEAHLGNLKRGIEALETALGLGLPDRQRHETELAIKRLRGKLN